MEDLHERIVKTIVEEPPVSFAEGGVIRAGVDAELDELRELGRSRDGRRWRPSRSGRGRGRGLVALKLDSTLSLGITWK